MVVTALRWIVWSGVADLYSLYMDPDQEFPPSCGSGSWLWGSEYHIFKLKISNPLLYSDTDPDPANQWIRILYGYGSSALFYNTALPTTDHGNRKLMIGEVHRYGTTGTACQRIQTAVIHKFLFKKAVKTLSNTGKDSLTSLMAMAHFTFQKNITVF
jgi:hypothetical protein